MTELIPCPPPGAGDQEYVSVPVPPEAVTEAVPFAPPLQLTFVPEMVAVIAGGWVMDALAVAVQPKLFVTVTVYGPPTGTPVTVCVEPKPDDQE